MRRVCSQEAGLTRGGLRDEIAADIARCQAKRPETADLHVGKVLTDPTACTQDRVQRRAHGRRLGIIDEIGIDAPGEIEHCGEQCLTRRE